MAISGGVWGGARRTACVAALCVGCRSAAPTPIIAPAATPRQPTRVLPRDSVFVLEAWGASANDTVVTVSARAGRVVILRHGPPDNTVFAQLVIRPDSSAGAQDSLSLTIRPRPGLYGVDIESTGPLGAGTTLMFKYPVHFSPPLAARDRYSSRAAFERALGIGHVTGDGRIVLLPSTQPASDNLEAEIPGPGRYLVAAPR